MWDVKEDRGTASVGTTPEDGDDADDIVSDAGSKLGVAELGVADP